MKLILALLKLIEIFFIYVIPLGLAPSLILVNVTLNRVYGLKIYAVELLLLFSVSILIGYAVGSARDEYKKHLYRVYCKKRGIDPKKLSSWNDWKYNQILEKKSD
ncbi:hypothetical protein CAY60_021260 [Shouchella clausii]|uniref:hypothetical protein n=1 Tax=Bacteria TaxID=2 RepID=UPI0004E7B431|nr:MULTISPECIES: hypothetical protein [Bacteria]ALA55221.1 hypothetical protein DB29_0P0009 [Shouchella clausii]MBU3266286.1 hypothetical protein [Shouchella clausii]MBU3509379.1 hypothetical protein [Shouchella clausii]MDP0461982.1 hypothetical protein [Shouchella rhizosphaerae]MDP5267777.1 hypothetical protein [Shouchella clausii]